MKYKISKEGLNDLENIWIFTFEKWSIEQADRYYGLFMDEIEYISAPPNQGKIMDILEKDISEPV